MNIQQRVVKAIIMTIALPFIIATKTGIYTYRAWRAISSLPNTVRSAFTQREVMQKAIAHGYEEMLVKDGVDVFVKSY